MNGQLLKLKNARAHKGEGSSVQNLTCLFFSFFLKEDLIFFGRAIQLQLEQAEEFYFLSGCCLLPFCHAQVP